MVAVMAEDCNVFAESDEYSKISSFSILMLIRAGWKLAVQGQ